MSKLDYPGGISQKMSNRDIYQTSLHMLLKQRQKLGLLCTRQTNASTSRMMAYERNNCLTTTFHFHTDKTVVRIGNRTKADDH